MDKPIYQKNTEETLLFNKLRKRVKDRVAYIPENRDVSIQWKAIILPLLYIGLYTRALVNAQYPFMYSVLFASMGILLVLIYLNLIYEAAHNNIFTSKKLNALVLRIFVLVG